MIMIMMCMRNCSCTCMIRIRIQFQFQHLNFKFRVEVGNLRSAYLLAGAPTFLGVFPPLDRICNIYKTKNVLPCFVGFMCNVEVEDESKNVRN